MTDPERPPVDPLREALTKEVARALTLLRVEGTQSNEAYAAYIADYLTGGAIDPNLWVFLDRDRAASPAECRCFEDFQPDHPATSTDTTPLGQHMPWCPLASPAAPRPEGQLTETKEWSAVVDVAVQQERERAFEAGRATGTVEGWADWTNAPRPEGLDDLTGGDLAKALHDTHAVLGYWPDADKIGGQWEVWGEALLVALLGAAPRPEGLDEPLRVMGAMAHHANRDHADNDGCIVCVAARPILARLSATSDTEEPS